MPNTIRIVKEAFVNNEQNFIQELRDIFHENEYSLNERTKVAVRGHIDWNEIRTYIQFFIETDEVKYWTDFYRDDFSIDNKVVKDGLDGDETVNVLKLTADDIKRI